MAKAKKEIATMSKKACKKMMNGDKGGVSYSTARGRDRGGLAKPVARLSGAAARALSQSIPASLKQAAKAGGAVAKMSRGAMAGAILGGMAKRTASKAQISARKAFGRMKR